MKRYIVINKILENPSLCDGPGYRTVLFLQGCHRMCKGCHNPSTWNIQQGKTIAINQLVKILKTKAFNQKITISGGEPLLQKDALIVLIKKLKNFDICLYTSYELDDVPQVILKRIHYLKTGPYLEALKDARLTYYGSKNQKLFELRKGKVYEK